MTEPVEGPRTDQAVRCARFYDTQAARYVSLEDIAGILTRAGAGARVGGRYRQDVTQAVLARIIADYH